MAEKNEDHRAAGGGSAAPVVFHQLPDDLGGKSIDWLLMYPNFSINRAMEPPAFDSQPVDS
jgi:hypothetical protein